MTAAQIAMLTPEKSKPKNAVAYQKYNNWHEKKNITCIKCKSFVGIRYD